MEGGVGVVAGRWVGALVSCALLLAACSSGDDAAPETTVSTTTTSVAVETTTTTSTSSSSSSTDVDVDDVPPSTAPPTTSDPKASVEAAVRAAVDLAIADFSACLVAMPNCDPATLAATRADPLLAVNVGRVTEWNGEGYTVIDRDQFRHVIESVELSDDLRRATVTVCFADGSKLIDPGAGPDGADLIIDGTFVSGREAWDMRLGDDGIWRAHDAPLIGTTEVTTYVPPGDEKLPGATVAAARHPGARARAGWPGQRWWRRQRRFGRRSAHRARHLPTGGGSGGDGCSWERIDGEFGVSRASAQPTFPFVDENGVTQILWRRIVPGRSGRLVPDAADDARRTSCLSCSSSCRSEPAEAGADVRDARPGEQLGVRHGARRLPGRWQLVAHGVGDRVDRSGVGDGHGAAGADDVRPR